MADLLKVEIEAISDAVSRLEDAAAAIGRSLRTLESRSLLLQAGWSGEASEAYTAAHRDWTARVDTLNALLARATGALTAARERYQATEAVNRDRWI